MLTSPGADDRFADLGGSASPSRFSSFAMKRDTSLPSTLPPGPKVSYHKNVTYPEYKKDRYLELFGAEVDYGTGTFRKFHSSDGNAKMPVVEPNPRPAAVFVRDRTRQLTLGLGPPYVEHGYISPKANMSEAGLGGSMSLSSKFLSHSYGRLYKHLAETYYADGSSSPKSFKRARNLLGPQTSIRDFDHLNNPVDQKPKVMFKGVTIIRPPTPPPPPPPPPPTEEEWSQSQAKGPGRRRAFSKSTDSAATSATPAILGRQAPSLNAAEQSWATEAMQNISSQDPSSPKRPGQR